MVCVDSSVWIAAFADGQSREAQHLSDLLDADLVILPRPVRVELLAGAPKKSQAVLRQRLAAVPPAIPTQLTWDRIEDWVAVAVDAGQRFGMADLLIAASAADHGAEIWSLDADFGRMEKLGFLARYQSLVTRAG
jgi:predicted nucleic acid-binding protein